MVSGEAYRYTVYSTLTKDRNYETKHDPTINQPNHVSNTVGASSQCYRGELIVLKCELMLVKCQINTNTNTNEFSISTKCLERVLKYS